MSQNKKKILIFIDWYLPAYKAGGPVRSVANMIARLKYDFEFRIVTSDRDLNDNHPFGGITINEWSTATDGTAVIYLGPDKQNYQTIRKIIQEERADFIYLNSLFSKKFTLLPLVVRKKHFPHRKVILACRGMLGAGSMQNKKLKKMLFLATARIWGLYKNIRWQSTSELESKEITDMFGKHISISLVPNLSDPTITVVNPTSAKAKGSLRMLYIGRISPVKNLELLLKILSHIPPEGEVILDVYGAIDDESYWSQCEKLISKMPEYIKVSYRGTLPYERIRNLWCSYHISILLTLNENFGHSILESLAAGVPVIISKFTPWHGLEKAKAGFDLPLEDEGAIVDTIRYFLRMDDPGLLDWRLGSREYAEKVINNSGQAEKYKNLFK